MIHLTDPRTDEDLLAIVQHALNESVRCASPSQAYVVQIDGWFDYKWQAFSGTTMHEIAIWRHKLTLPPFHPTRVLNQTHWQLRADGSDYEISAAKPLHISQPSDANLRRYVTDVASSAIFLWYSSVESSGGRGSLMIYVVDRGESSGWYAGLTGNGKWRLAQVKGASRREVQEILFARAASNNSLDRSG